MQRHDWPHDHLFDPSDPANVLANASFECVREGVLCGWEVLDGEIEQVARGDGFAGRLSGAVRSNRFEMPAHVPYEITGEANGELTIVVHILEHDRYLRSERFVVLSSDWQAFSFRLLPPPNAERAEVELRGSGVLVDELRLDGLGAREYEILDAQAGYHPHGAKRALFRSRGDLTGDIRWEVIDTLRGVTSAEGVLYPKGRDIWGRWLWLIDFTSCEREGNYILRVYPPGEIVELSTVRIRSDLHLDLARLVTRYSYLQRCGTDIPGYHDACHVNDGLLRVTEQGDRYGEILEYREMIGGWHDAGDYNKWYHYYGYVLETLALMRQRIGAAMPEADREALHSEICWGADFIAKMQNADGSFLGPICAWYSEDDAETGEKKNSPWAVFWEEPEEDSGSGEVMHPRSRGVTYSDALPSPAQALDYATSLAASARAVHEIDGPRAWTYVNAARRAVAWLLDGDPDLADHPYFVTLWYSLYRVTGLDEYRASADELIPKLLGRQLDNGSFGPASGLKHTFHALTVLMELLLDEPEHPAREQILDAATRLIPWLDGYVMKDAGYDLVLQALADADPGVLTSEAMGHNAWIANVAYVYALAGRVTGTREWLHRGEDQLAWILGRNPHGVCQMTDAGRVHPGRYHGYMNLNHNDLRGAITGGIVNGIDLPDAGHTTWTTMPPLFPIMSVRRTDVPYSDHHLVNARHDTNEYWSLHHAAFQQAVSALGAAYEDVPGRPLVAYLFGNELGYDDSRTHDELFERLGVDADRIMSDLRYPHFDPRAYVAIVVGASWAGGQGIDADPLGLTVRQSFEIGKPWVFVNPSEAALKWLGDISSGPTGYGELGPPEGSWETEGALRRRRIHGSDVFAVGDASALEAVLTAIAGEESE